MADDQSRIDEALRRIDELDFSLIRSKLAHSEHGPAWPEARIQAAEADYVDFLALVYAYPSEALVPSELADSFWHYHILDTRAYAHDCQHVFGFFLHHFPYLGIRSESDEKLLAHCAKKTDELRQRHFQAAGLAAAYCGGGGGGSCSACSSSMDPRQFQP